LLSHFNNTERELLRAKWKRFGQIGVLLLAGVVGNLLALMRTPVAKVHAEERFSGITNCVTVIPKSWGDFKGGSEYGLAFQDENGVVRFVLHPTCGSVNSPAELPPAPIDLEVQRR
jgi:hypothetical protein